MDKYRVMPLRRGHFTKVEGVSNDYRVWTHDTLEWGIVMAQGELVKTGFRSYGEAEQAISELP